MVRSSSVTPPATEFVPRSPRVPLFVPVTTHPVLRNCWSSNVSATGLALVGIESGKTAIKPGDSIDVEFRLPGRANHVHGRCRVEWRTWLGAQQSSVAFGLSFSQLAATLRADLVGYVNDYLPRVGVLRASPAERTLCQERLGISHRLQFADDLAALMEQPGHDDLWAIAVFGSEVGLRPIVEQIATAPPRRGELGPVPLVAEDRPRVVFCGKAPTELLLRLHNEGGLHWSIPAPVQGDDLCRAVQRACAEYGIRFEQGRAALELGRLRQKTYPAIPLPQPTTHLEELVAESESMRNVLGLVRAAAKHRVHVLLQGETGAGKELVAMVLHELSDRAKGPFVALDCGTLTETLLESELFGHVKGAFTGAETDHLGLFRLAEGGTILIDEIQSMSQRLQAKLLRVLETSEVRPVGSTKVHSVDIRLIAASNRDLKAEVEAGRVRADLFYRLDRFPIELPPLRQRRADILPIAQCFLRKVGQERAGRPPVLGQAAELALLAYDWPGNVRELRNVIERASLLCGSDDTIALTHLPANVRGAAAAAHDEKVPAGGDSLRDRLLDVERELIHDALVRHKYAIGRAAEELRTNRVTLARRARSLGLWPPPPGITVVDDE